MDADSVGINAVLAGIASELEANILFTPEYSDKTRGSVRELRVAAEMMMVAKSRASVPKDIGMDLLMLKEKTRKPVSMFYDYDTDTEIIVAQETETWRMDPKGCFRIGIANFFAAQKPVLKTTKRIYAEHLPSKKIIEGRSAKEVMDEILRRDMISLPDHVSYVSRELMKAELALKMGRSYMQDEEL
jgi:dihydropteroate synthase-like protein